MVQQSLGLAHGNVDSIILEAPVELLLVNFAVTIIVHDAERSAHATDGPDSACLQASFHLFKNFREKDTVKTV